MTILLLGEKSEVFHMVDPYRVHEYANEYLGAHKLIVPAAHDPKGGLKRCRIASIDLFQFSYGERVSINISSPDDDAYYLHMIMSGACSLSSHGHEHDFIPGEILLINPDDTLKLRYSNDYEKLVIRLPASLIKAVCDERQYVMPRDGVHFSPVHRLSQENNIFSLLSLVCREAENEPNDLQIQRHYAKILVGKLLSLPGNNLRLKALAGESVSFDRIEEVIEQNLKNDISLNQLAELLDVSIYSLFPVFEKHVHTTPKRYIRQRKLEAVRIHLSDPAAVINNITEVALSYGFYHLGRFAEMYRNAFGELPSETFSKHHED
ncbi:AraC family transcriptional regulator [Pseudomonas aeruginosa]